MAKENGIGVNEANLRNYMLAHDTDSGELMVAMEKIRTQPDRVNLDDLLETESK